MQLIGETVSYSSALPLRAAGSNPLYRMSKEDAGAALAATEGSMQQALGDLLKGPPARKVFEVWQPKA
ncbi:MAG: hypothetical protein WBB22_12330 [Anaerolineae bacterium]